jgi:hypothetical protein
MKNLIEAFILKDGRTLIPAYTVSSVFEQETNFTYWLVTLHDFIVADSTQLNVKVSHDEAAAQAFAAQQRGKPQ